MLGARRGWQPDEELPLPFLPRAVILLGHYTIAAPFSSGSGAGSTAAISLVVAGLVFVVPSMTRNR